MRFRVIFIGQLFMAGLVVSASPVLPNLDRFFRDQPAKLVEAGEILLTQLHCVNCHLPGDEYRERIPVILGPDLVEVYSRLRPDYLLNWLAEPHAVKAGTRMPDLLAAKSIQQRQSVAGSLAEYLSTLDPDESFMEYEGFFDLEKGKQLFHSIGCVACHAPFPDYLETDSGVKVFAQAVEGSSVLLVDLKKKYRFRGLIEFLRDPLRFRPSGGMPDFNLRHQEAVDIASYLLEMTDSAVPSTLRRLPEPESVETGKAWFVSLGCGQCHPGQTESRRITSHSYASPLKTLGGRTGGCLSTQPQEGIPHYSLDSFQRRALRVALQSLPSVKPLLAAERVHREMVRLNCLNCHERNGEGGPEPQRLKYFTSSGSDLGGEGRVPPTLTGVGRKMRLDAVARTIQGRFPSRPYMVTRMPGFGDYYSQRFAAGFAEIDANPDEKPTPRNGNENQVGRNMWGRALIGTQGLSCITCHRLNGNKSLGIPAMDLALAPQRLRPEWFRDYLIDPAHFRPGTRMPSFWPEGVPSLKGYGGSTSRQIDSLWVYLNEIDQSRLPVGLEDKGDFFLIPERRPIVFRTFMEHAGNHAIAVGFSAEIHAAFDSLNPRWVMAWTGQFLNAESTWDDRFTPLTKPAGENLVMIQSHVPVQEGEVEFMGYGLEGDSRYPVFRYRINEHRIADRVEPSVDSEFRLIRTLELQNRNDPIWVEVASGNRIVGSNQKWKIDEMLLVVTSTQGRIIKTDTGEHLQVLVGNSKSEKHRPEAFIHYQW